MAGGRGIILSIFVAIWTYDFEFPLRSNVRPTGPLGQGIANAVGLAAIESHLSARFNKDDAKVVDHYT